MNAIIGIVIPFVFRERLNLAPGLGVHAILVASAILFRRLVIALCFPRHTIDVAIGALNTFLVFFSWRDEKDLVIATSTVG